MGFSADAIRFFHPVFHPARRDVEAPISTVCLHCGEVFDRVGLLYDRNIHCEHRRSRHFTKFAIICGQLPAKRVIAVPTTWPNSPNGRMRWWPICYARAAARLPLRPPIRSMRGGLRCRYPPGRFRRGFRSGRPAGCAPDGRSDRTPLDPDHHRSKTLVQVADHHQIGPDLLGIGADFHHQFAAGSYRPDRNAEIGQAGHRLFRMTLYASS